MSALTTFYFNTASASGKVKTYTTGKTYKVNDLVTDPTHTLLYLVKEDFVASGNLAEDITNGYLVNIGSYDSYKQLEVTGVVGGNSITIDLSTLNSKFNRHVFVLKYIPPTDTTATLTNNQLVISSDSFFFVNDENGAGIATTWLFPTTYITPNSVNSEPIDLTIFNNIVRIEVE